MAVTMTAKRVHVLKGTNGTDEISTATLAGTYTTGGFTYNLTGLTGGSGTSPYGGAPIMAIWTSPLGYIYYSTFAGQVMTTKILTAANTEFTNGTAVPEATVPFALLRRIVY